MTHFPFVSTTYTTPIYGSRTVYNPSYSPFSRLQDPISSRPFDYFPRPHHDLIPTNNYKEAPIAAEAVIHTPGTKIVVVLDESGSMEPIREKMIESINSFIKEQKQVAGRTCTFSLVKFNGDISNVITDRDLREVSLLSYNDYIPNGTTALYDAIGNTISRFRYERDVIMVIITDGQNNSSKDYNKRLVQQMIDEKKKYMGWSYIYLSSDLNTAADGDGLGFHNDAYSANCCVPQNNFASFMSNSLNNAVSNYRTKGISVQSQLQGFKF